MHQLACRLIIHTGLLAKNLYLPNKAIAEDKWALPMRLSLIPSHVFLISWKKTPSQCKRWLLRMHVMDTIHFLKVTIYFKLGLMRARSLII